MTYATLDMLKGAFGEANLVSATDRSGTGSIDVSAVERALVGADATIDAALAVRYRLPLAVVPTIVSEIAVSIALYKLHVFAPDQKVKDDHDQALKDLDRIANGTRKLDVAGIEPQGSGSGGVIATDRVRPLTPETMRGFI